MKKLKINHLAVWLCIVLMHGFGFLWYGPLFGDQWMAYVQIDTESMQTDSMNPMIWVLNSVAIIAPMYLLAWLLANLDIRSGIRGAVISFLVVFVIYHLPLMNAYSFAGEPAGLSWITGGYAVTWLTVSGFVLGQWTKEQA
jgi:hypothetical protein